MKKLIYYEIRKLMSIKAFVMISILVFLLPMMTALENVTGDREVGAYKDMYAHEITDEWMETVSAKFEEIQQEEKRLVEEHKGTIAYGSVLSEDKQNLQHALGQAISAGTKILLKKEQNGFAIIEDNEEPYVQERIEYEKSLYDDKETYYFGSTLGGDFIITSLWYGGVILSIYCLYLFSKLFNEEYRGQFCDVLKTTKLGKRKVASAKVFTMLALSILGAAIYMAFTFLIAFLFLHPQFDITFAASRYGGALHFLNFGDAVVMACVLFFTVLPTFAILASLFSSLIKSTFVSLAASLLLFLIPLFMRRVEIAGVDISAFMPSNLILFNNTIYSQPYGFIQGHGYFYYQVMPIFWGLIGILLCIFIYIKFQRRAHA